VDTTEYSTILTHFSAIRCRLLRKDPGVGEVKVDQEHFLFKHLGVWSSS
jgi:hypothetical protein